MVRLSAVGPLLVGLALHATRVMAAQMPQKVYGVNLGSWCVLYLSVSVLRPLLRLVLAAFSRLLSEPWMFPAGKSVAVNSQIRRLIGLDRMGGDGRRSVRRLLELYCFRVVSSFLLDRTQK